MSFLNDLLGTHVRNAAVDATLMSTASQLIEKAGGVQGLAGVLQQHGLGEAVQSWVGTGANQPISGELLGQALQNGGLGSLVEEAASKLGMDQNELLGQIAQVLPHVVNSLTPDGQMPSQGGIDLGSFAALAGEFFGGGST